LSAGEVEPCQKGGKKDGDDGRNAEKCAYNYNNFVILTLMLIPL
jgi:hypothetical protein